MNITSVSALIAVIGALVVIVNLLTEVIKKATWSRLPTNIVVVLLSEGLTLASGAAYAQINSVTITWYAVVAAVVVGLLVAYGAMFGFDKLKEALAQITIGDKTNTVPSLQVQADADIDSIAAAIAQKVANTKAMEDTQKAGEAISDAESK